MTEILEAGRSVAPEMATGEPYDQGRAARAAAVLRSTVCYTSPPMPNVLTALDAFVQEHRRCGELDGGVEGGRVWMTCDCGAHIAHPATAEPAWPDR